MDIREQIRAELERQGKSVYWLANRLRDRKVCSDNHFYLYMRGRKDATGKIIGAALDELDLELKPRNKP